MHHTRRRVHVSSVWSLMSLALLLAPFLSLFSILVVSLVLPHFFFMETRTWGERRATEVEVRAEKAADSLKINVWLRR